MDLTSAHPGPPGGHSPKASTRGRLETSAASPRAPEAGHGFRVAMFFGSGPTEEPPSYLQGFSVLLSIPPPNLTQPYLVPPLSTPGKIASWKSSPCRQQQQSPATRRQRGQEEQDGRKPPFFAAGFWLRGCWWRPPSITALSSCSHHPQPPSPWKPEVPSTQRILSE